MHCDAWRDMDAEALRGFLTRLSARKAALAHQGRSACDDERRQLDMAEAAVFQRAEQPEGDFKRSKRVGREVRLGIARD